MNGYCQIPGCEKPAEGKTGLCPTHNKARRQELPEAKPRNGIKRVSTGRKKALDEFHIEQEKFCRGKRCAVYPMMNAIEVHHKRGREHDKFADDWARDNGISLLMDKRFWLPVSRKGHVRIELNPILAKKEGFSDSRLTDGGAPIEKYLPETKIPPTI